jgi:hypothetical protein
MRTTDCAGTHLGMLSACAAFVHTSSPPFLSHAIINPGHFGWCFRRCSVVRVVRAPPPAMRDTEKSLVRKGSCAPEHCEGE